MTSDLQVTAMSSARRSAREVWHVMRSALSLDSRSSMTLHTTATELRQRRTVGVVDPRSISPSGDCRCGTKDTAKGAVA